MQQVYSILMAQLTTTLTLVLVSFCSESFREIQREEMWILYTCFPLAIVSFLILSCCGSLAKKVPINYILLSLCTLAGAYIISFISSRFDPTTVIMATTLTFSVVTSLTAYAFWVKTDFQFLFGLSFMGILVLGVGGILAVIFRGKWLSLGLCILGATLFGVYLIADTQMIVGKH